MIADIPVTEAPETTETAKRKVFLACPRYYVGEGGYSTIPVLEAMTSQRSSIMVSIKAHSGLCYCFNTHWADALNRNPRPDWFVMLHADIRPVVKHDPDVNWIDFLIDGAEALGLDCLSCVVAIKDTQGDTSTAVEDLDKKTWPGLKRLSFKDVEKLPAVFTSDDVDGHLLLNTGCMAVRFTDDWVERFSFMFEDWIEKLPDGTFQARMMPEDWGMSMWMRDNGLKFGATSAIGCKHLGSAEFTWPEEKEGDGTGPKPA